MRPTYILSIVLAGAAVAANAAPASFPTVTPADQRARDVARRDILEAELSTEQAALAAARAALLAEPTDARRADLHRHRENVQALRRELAALAGQPVPPAVRVAARETHPSATARSDEPAPFWDVYRRTRSAAPTTSIPSD